MPHSRDPAFRDTAHLVKPAKSQPNRPAQATHKKSERGCSLFAVKVSAMSQYRAVFDAEISFRNGGGIAVNGFRLDIAEPSITEDELAHLLIRHLGLLMVDQVEFSQLEVVEEDHKGSRGGPSDLAGSHRPGQRRLIELSHHIEAGMTTYPGLPGPEISAHMSREDSRSHYTAGTEFNIDRITMVGNTGTYLDSPFHRYADGTDLAGLDLAALADLPIVIIDVTGSTQRAITANALAPYEVFGAAVLLHTGWDAHWRTDTYGDALHAPFLTGDGARYLVDNGAALIGIDAVNLDDTTGNARPAHSILLDATVPVLEHLTHLADLPVTGARLHAVPPPFQAVGTFPVRAYALVE